MVLYVEFGINYFGKKKIYVKKGGKFYIVGYLNLFVFLCECKGVGVIFWWGWLGNVMGWEVMDVCVCFCNCDSLMG